MKRSFETMALTSAEPALVAEILEAPARFDAVRVTGRLTAYCAVANVAELEHRGATVRVKTANLENALELHLDRLYSFIGEVERCEGSVRVRARVGRDVDGLDVGLWEAALRLDRDRAASESAG